MDEPRFLKFTNPATGEEFGSVPMHSRGEVCQANHEMRSAFNIWGSKPVGERVRALRKLQEVMLDSLDEITAVMNQDCGKSRQDALIEVFITLDMLQVYLKHARQWLKREPISTGWYIFKRAYSEPRPYGVVGVISPWNYPFALSMPPVIAALLAGNTVLLKPSEVTAATGVMIEKLFQRVPELAPYIRVLHGDGSVGAAMVESGLDYIFITGSTGTGRKVMQTAAETLTPVACELGGKDAMIVLEDADIQAAAHWGVWGAFFNTGQTCMSVERVYVHEAVYDEFVRAAVQETQALKVGYSPDLKSPYYLGPITDPRQVKIIDRHLEDAQAKGARVLVGGERVGMFYEPAVLVDVDHSMLLMREETFGPLLPIVRVKDEAEAIHLANDSSYGLGGSVWSRDLKHARRVAHQLQAASILINDTIAQFAVPLLPFGGVKQSGSGRTHGKQGLLQFTQPYSYVYGPPPPAFDLGTIARKPGNYPLLASVMHLLFGVNTRQRIQPLNELLDKPVDTPRLSRRSLALGLGAGLSLAGAATTFALGLRKKKYSHAKGPDRTG